MEPTFRRKLSEFKSIISKMPVEVFCSTVLPELDIQWSELRETVRKNRLPLTSASIARILTRVVSKQLPEEEIDEIVAKLRIKLIATSPGRTWHTILLENPLSEDLPPLDVYIKQLPNKVLQASRKVVRGYNTHVQVHKEKVGDMLYISVQRIAPNKQCVPLYMATPPGEQVGFVSSLANKNLIKAVAYGLGFQSYTEANLSGPDLTSLLQIMDRNYNFPAHHLVEPPVYDPKPVITKKGIDYTNKAYDKEYIENLIGPNPPLLKTLELTSTSTFSAGHIHKDVKIVLKISSTNIAETLKNLAEIRAIKPTSQLFRVFDTLKQNKLEYERDDDDDDDDE